MRVPKSSLAALVLILASASAMGQTCKKTPSAEAPPSLPQLAGGALDLAELPNLKDDPTAIVPGRVYVLQLDRPLSEQMRREVYATGAALVESFPGNAYVAMLDRAHPDELARLEYVRWIGEYRSDWKISPTLDKRLGEVDVTITVFGWHSADAAREVVVAAGGTVNSADRALTNELLRATIPALALDDLAELVSVRYVSEAVAPALRAGSTIPSGDDEPASTNTPLRTRSRDDLPSPAERRARPRDAD